jgi:hypothetical protein
MTASAVPGYVLLDPRINAAEAPYTFFLPDPDALAAVRSGDMVKLMFEHVPAGQEWGVERMWVTVEAAEGESLRGVLDNEPREPTASVRCGDPVAFARHHIIAIEWAYPECAPPSPPRRDYWEFCIVDDCVLDGSEPVEFLYREAPANADEGDRRTDSGWRIRGRMGAATDDEIAERSASYVALGAVLNQDDSWIELIDAPVGSEFMRDFERGVFVSQS